jgi:hypothetical protein
MPNRRATASKMPELVWGGRLRRWWRLPVYCGHASARNEFIEGTRRHNHQASCRGTFEISQSPRNAAGDEVGFPRLQIEHFVAHRHFELSTEKMHRFVFAKVNMQAPIASGRHSAFNEGELAPVPRLERTIFI